MKWIGVFAIVFILNSLCFAADSATDFFESNIRPLLIKHCFECHGRSDVESGLRVDSREALLTGGDNGPAILPGRADQSLLIQALRHTHDIKMPPQQALKWMDC